MVREFFLVFCLIALAPAAKAAENIDFGRYHALVIGNNDYQHLKHLETAVSDAAAVAEVLRGQYGFDVILLLNATRAEILTELNNLRATLTEKDQLLIYYAGHGELDPATGTGYWLPIDAEPRDDTNWIANDSLTRHLKAMTARHVLVVADSCFSGALVRGTSVAPKSGAERDQWLQRMAEKRGRTALVSGGLEPVLDEGSEGHSVFANAFLGVLRENETILDGEELGRQVTQKVVLNADQTPRYTDLRKADHDGGDFLFVPKGLAAPATADRDTGNNDGNEKAMEIAFWNSIKDSDNPEAFEAYLDKYPRGTFAPLALLKIDELKAPRMPPERQAEPAVPPAAVIAIEERNETLVALKNANVRDAPSIDGAKITTLEQGTSVLVTGKVKGKDWYRIERDGKAAYVYAQLLGEPPAPTEDLSLLAPAAGGARDATPDTASAGTHVASLEDASGPVIPNPVTPATRRPETGVIGTPQAAQAILNIQPVRNPRGQEIVFLTQVVRDRLGGDTGTRIVERPPGSGGYDILITTKIARVNRREETNMQYQSAVIAGQIIGGALGIRPPTPQTAPTLAVYDVEVIIEARDAVTGEVLSETGAATLKTDSRNSYADGAGNALMKAAAEAAERLATRLKGEVPAPRPLPDENESDKSAVADDPRFENRAPFETGYR